MPRQKKLDALSDAREILKTVRQSCRQNLGRLLGELQSLCTNPDVSPNVRVSAIKLLLEYSTGGPPNWSTASDMETVKSPNTDEYREWRQYEMARFKAWQASQELAPIDPTLIESPSQVVLDIRPNGVDA